MNFGRNFTKFGDFGHVRNFLTNEIQNPGCNQGSRYRPVRPNRRGPVPVYRTGLAGNRSKLNLNLKSSVQMVRTGIPVGLTGLPTGLIGNPPNSIFFSFLVLIQMPAKYTK